MLCPTTRWDALQRLLFRLLTRLYDAAEEQGDSIDDMESLSALLAQSGGMPPALLAALEAALAAEDLDGEYQVCFGHMNSATSLTGMYCRDALRVDTGVVTRGRRGISIVSVFVPVPVP